MPHFLLAFGFGSLAMLGWLAAAAAPLLIHLWSRHRFREAPWAAMQFLLAAMRKNARRLQLQQWLLLAIRTLIIALVVLAVAEPYGEQLLAGGSSVPTHKFLVLDGSYSMDYRDDNAARFARAKKSAAAIVHNSRPADSFTVILMAAPAKIILDREIIDHAAVVAEIDTLKQSHTSADLPGALTLIEDAIKQGQADRRLAARHEVYFFTDLQRKTWSSGSHAPRGNPLPSRSRGDGASDSATTQSVGIVRSHAERGNEALNDQITALSKQTAIALIDIAEPNSVNLAITSLRASSPFVTTNRETTFDVTLHQFADQPRRQCVIELLVDGERVGEQTVDVAAGSDAVARFTHRFQSPGQHAIEARAANDRLPVDNTRWLVVPVRDEIRVLCIAGRSGAARYIADALNPNPAGDSPIRPVVISEGDLADVDLAGFDCVFACNVAQFTPSEAQRLARYAAAGGGVVFFLGDRVIADNYNTHAQGSKPSPEGTGSLIPAQLGPIISQPSFGLDPLEYRHPIVAPFRGRERAGLLTTPVARYHRLELPRDRADVAVAAAIQNGHPFIVTAPLGRGRTILVATDGSLTSVDATSGEPWTSWPTWPSFLPLIRELLAYATSGQQQEWQQLVGAPLVNDAMSANIKNADSSALRIERPDGQSAPLSINSGTDWSYTDTNLSGIYTLHGLPENATLQFAVNVDTTESDLAKAEPQQLPPELNIGSISNEATGAATGANLSRAGLNESFLWIALAFLFVESFLAWQFGRGVA
jgi:hypothetical protein